MEDNKKKLERKRFQAKDEKGNKIWDITAVSAVSQPAIERDFQKFQKASPATVVFRVTNEEKMELTGAAMIPDQDILRQDQETGEFYYCYFTEQDVNDFAEMFLFDANHNQANFEHQDSFTDKIKLKESWIVEDPANDKSAALGFKDIPKGSWFITYKCVDPNLWEEIKTSNLKGFSIEISSTDFNKYETKNNWNYLLINNSNMNFLKRIENKLFNKPEETAATEQVNFKDTKLQDGSTVRITEDLIVGAKVEVINEDATLSIPSAGDLTLEDGTIVSVDENGIITEIASPEAEAEEGEEMAAETPAPVETISKDEFSALSIKVDELFAAVDMIVKAISGNKNEMSSLENENKDLKAKNEELSKLASAPEVNHKKFERTINVKVDRGNTPKNELLEKLIAIRESKEK